MSTKIYDAYLYHGNITQLLAYFQRARERYWDVCADQLLTHAESRGMKLLEVEEKMREASKQGMAGDFFNLDAGASVYFDKGKIYVQFFGIDGRGFGKEWRKKLAAVFAVKKPKFTDFHYQNQTDWPEGMSKKEWKNREKVWDRIFGKFHVPAQAGLCYDFFKGPGMDCGMMMYHMAELRKKRQEAVTK